MAQKRIPITKLQVGAFVESVSKQLGDVHVVQNGLVKNIFALNDLKKKGVIEVIIDTDRSTFEQDDSQEKHLRQAQLKTLPFTDAVIECTEFVSEFEAGINDNLKRARLQQPIDMLGLERLAQMCFHLTARHHHCLACLIRSKFDGTDISAHMMRFAITMTQICHYLKKDQKQATEIILAAVLSPLGRLLVNKELQAITATLPKLYQVKKQKHIDLCLRLIALSCEPSPITIELIKNQAERLDGSGYPRQLTIDSLSENQNLFNVALQYDALVFGFDQIRALGITQVIRQMMDHSPIHFDPDSITTLVKAIGVYPAGSLVKLKSKRLALVLECDSETPTQPKVKAFYNLAFNHHLKHSIIDLTQSDDAIDSTVRRQKYDLEIDTLL